MYSMRSVLSFCSPGNSTSSMDFLMNVQLFSCLFYAFTRVDIIFYMFDLLKDLGICLFIDTILWLTLWSLSSKYLRNSFMLAYLTESYKIWRIFFFFKSISLISPWISTFFLDYRGMPSAVAFGDLSTLLNIFCLKELSLNISVDLSITKHSLRSVSSF